MTAYRILSVILGILVAIGGIYIVCAPGLAIEFVAIIASIAMIVEGIGSIIKWNDQRKAGISDTFTLVGGIISLIVGIIVLFGFFAKFAFATILIYFVIAWLIIVGIMRISASFKIKNAIKNNDIQNPKISWGWMLAAGILMVLCGVLCIFQPFVLAAFLGIMVGISVIVAGVSLIVAGFSA